MFTEILKIKPQLDGKDLSAMENSLNGRFKKIAKKFGSGLLDVIKGGGIAGLALGLIDKLLNPLKEVQEAIEKSLKGGDDLATYAKQFNTTAGNLARLQAFGKASGLDAEGVRMLLVKFQGAVAQSALKPGEITSTSAYVGKKDTAEAFFEFVQALQKLTPTQQNLVQQEVFGERQILKASEFLHADFAFLSKALGGPSAEQLTAAAEKLGTLNDMKDLLAARRDLKDLPTKAALIGPHTIGGIDRAANLDLSQENKNIAKAPDLEKIALANQKLINLAVNEFLKLAPLVAPLLMQLADKLGIVTSAVDKSRALRGIVPGAGKEK